MTRARTLSRLANSNVLAVDSSNNVGVGSTIPDAKLDVIGIVSATTFYGDGSSLSGVGVPGVSTTGHSVFNTINASGIVTASNFSIPADNGKFTCGAGDDLEIYHSGSDSYIKDVGTGDLIIQANSLRMSNTSGTNYLYGTTSAEVKLYHNGNVKLATNSGGVTVTGTVTTDQVTTDQVISGISTFTADVSIADKIIHTGNTSTAIRFPSANTIAAETDGSERLRIDSIGRLLIGTPTSIASAGTSGVGGGSSPALQVVHPAANMAPAGISLSRFQANNPYGAVFTIQKSRNDTIGGHTVVVSGDDLGVISFDGSDGTDFNTAATIRAAVDGTPGTDDMPGRLEFHTTADGSNSPTERLRIASDGVITTGTFDWSGTTTSGTYLNKHGNSAHQAIAGDTTRNLWQGYLGTTATSLIAASGAATFAGAIKANGGIDFSGAQTNLAGMTSELLDHYEEGTWTPAVSNFTVSGTTTTSGKYVKVGRQVTFGIKFANTGTIAYDVSCNISLPFAMTYPQADNGLIGMYQLSNSAAFDTNIAGTQCKLDDEGGSRFFPGSFTTTSSGTTLMFGGTYIASS